MYRIIALMNTESKNFLYKLLNTPSPTGFEASIQKVVKARMKKYAKHIETDLHGNMIVGINTKAKRRVMLAGHCDQIGFMVRYINKGGFIYVEPLGGIDPGVCPGSIVTIHTQKGPINGVIGRKPIHLQSNEERARMKLDLKKVWIDIGAADKKAAEKLVNIGDPITFKLGVTELGKDLIAAPGVDDRAGLFVVMEALRLCARAKLNVALYSVSTVQEEVGLRGAKTSAYSIDPDVGIGVDVTFSSDNPGKGGENEVEVALGKGPGIYCGPNVNNVVQKMLQDSAKKSKIPYQLIPSGRLLGNDTNAIQVNREGVAAASVALPNRYMHTPIEVVSLKDLENSAKLLAAFIKSIGTRTDFRPR